jgi:hypothetical protein
MLKKRKADMMEMFDGLETREKKHKASSMLEEEIKELKKENAELKKQNEIMTKKMAVHNYSICKILHEKTQCHISEYKRKIEELEKETLILKGGLGGVMIRAHKLEKIGIKAAAVLATNVPCSDAKRAPAGLLATQSPLKPSALVETIPSIALKVGCP